MKPPKKALIKIRRSWKINPLTKVKESERVYQRDAAQKELRKEIYDPEK